MAGQMEKIALGELALRGRVELEITDPLTGRPYYRFEDHNIVLDGLYQYLKTLCIAALCSYDGLYGYHPNTALGGSSTRQSTPVEEFYGLSLGVYGSAVAGSDRLPPTTRDERAALKCPVEAVSLTDGRAEPAAGDMVMDGTVIATADLRTQVASGVKNGVFTYAKSYENFRKLYRRWDWTSANGNGVLSKIYLHTFSRTVPPFLFEKSVSALSLPYSSIGSWTTAGQVKNHILYCKGLNNGTASFVLLTIEVGTAAMTAKEFTLDPAALGGSTQPGSSCFCMLETEEEGVFSIIPHNCKNKFILQVYRYDSNTGGISLEEYTGSRYYPDDPAQKDYLYYSETDSFSYRNLLAAYVDQDGQIVICSGYRYYQYKVPKSGNRLEFLSEYNGYSSDNGSFFNKHGYRYGQDGSYLWLYDAEGKKRYDKQNGRTNSISTEPWSYGFWYNFEGTKYVIGGLGDGLIYLCSVFWSASIPYLQVDAVPEGCTGLQIMTERLLPEPVVKDNMPMYVGYTLEFE